MGREVGLNSLLDASARAARQAHRLRTLTQADMFGHCALGAAGGSRAVSVSPVSYGSLFSIERLLAAGENVALLVTVNPDDARRAQLRSACNLVAARVTLRVASARTCRIRACVHAYVHGCLHAHGTCIRMQTCCFASGLGFSPPHLVSHPLHLPSLSVCLDTHVYTHAILSTSYTHTYVHIL